MTEYDGGKNIVSRSVLCMARERIQVDFLRLILLFESGSYDEMVGVSHSLAGLSLYLDLNDLAACCSEIESVSLQKDIEKMKIEMENLRDVVRGSISKMDNRITNTESRG
ncbi:Hpt domain-containing protein [Chromobacterium vaccinii]|uniref:Hpt domain-containing protein n=1 Tax=Chromobacterium vaccinii TaxID=1108595 RepID=UPI003C70BF06